MRYSLGSAADPKRHKADWNRTFDLPAETPAGGVLLLHGMSDSPYSLRALGEALKRRGYWVLGLRLPGHGTIPSGLLTATWEDMAAAMRIGVNHLAAQIGQAPIHLVGYSTGAPLALDYTLEALEGLHSPAPASLVLISQSPSAARQHWPNGWTGWHCFRDWSRWRGRNFCRSSIRINTIPLPAMPVIRCTA